MRTRFVKDDKNRYVRELVNVKRDRNKKVIPVVDDDSNENNDVRFGSSKWAANSTISTYSSPNYTADDSKRSNASNDYCDNGSGILPIIINTIL